MKKILLVCVLMLSALCSVSAEERFVGEYYGSGYYAEVDDITLTDEYLVTKISVKKPYYNRLIEENIRFHRLNRTYELLRVRLYNYNPRELLEDRKVSNVPLPILAGSPYEAVMNFVIAWQERTESDI